MKILVRNSLSALANVLVVAALSSCSGAPVYDAPPSIPINVFPAVAADIVANSKTTFTWRESANAHYYEFHIFDRSTSDIQKYYQRNLLAEDICIGGQCSVSIDVSMPIYTDHAWRVRAGNNAGLSNWTRNRFNMVGN